MIFRTFYVYLTDWEEVAVKLRWDGSKWTLIPNISVEVVVNLVEKNLEASLYKTGF